MDGLKPGDLAHDTLVRTGMLAVVAGEVKALAGQTAKATEDIAAQIAGMQQATARSITAIGAIEHTIRDLGVSAAALPFVLNLPSLGFANQAARKQRLVVMFSPDGVVPWNFWPEEEGSEFTLKESLTPLEPFKDKMLTLHGVCDRIRGDGDNHMRGIGCLLTGIELFPGNIQGGSHTPAGWASGISIDQEIKTFLQAKPETRTRFGSLEFGVMVPDRADTWTRMCYTAANKPITPIDDPYQMFAKLYGRTKDRESLKSVLDELQEDLQKVSSVISAADKRLLEEHTTLVRELEQELKAGGGEVVHAMPELEPGVKEENDNIPKITKLQIELMVNSFANDFARVASLQLSHVGSIHFGKLAQTVRERQAAAARGVRLELSVTDLGQCPGGTF
jgi:hypothetical protein